MGRRSRHSAKTGGNQSSHKSRTKAIKSSRGNRDDSGDDDPMYNEVERYHNRMEEENYLKLDDDDDDDDDGGDSSSEDDGITKHQEGVFDLGIRGSSEEEEDDDGDSDEDEEDEEDETPPPRAKKSYTASSDSDGSVSESEDDDAYGSKSSKLLNWGDKKYSYYHGDTADLEIGQDVEDAYLEEEAAREVEKAQLDGMDDEDFFLGTNEKSCEDEGPKSNNKRSRDLGNMEIIKSSKSPKHVSKLSDREKMKLLKMHHPELLPLVQHFSHSVSELSEITLVAAGAMLRHGITKCAKEMEAVGATPAGIQYLITKTMLQASKALNLSLYLLLKSDHASTNEDVAGVQLVMDLDPSDAVRNHPVMHRLNQLSVLTDKLKEGSLSESDEEHETQGAIQRRIMTEAKFALRNQDIDRDMEKVTNYKKRRQAPTSSDYGDENDEITDKTVIASRNLASTMNSIVQKSISSNMKRNKLDTEVDGERAIGKTIMKNRGLVAHKPKINRNPRVKKREHYRKALIRRKGAVREVRTDEGHVYGGEATGIKSDISRSRKLGSRR
ncbi:hypothetical protein ACHAXA_004104 [Cyclostephanos tholiformis]|uniref:Sas10 C-terminal domain-containing protein n=1 Tax=Cyclostephanos tholiformis TaxID=382380 RepID=A0ABD3SGY5_9STRA